MQKILVKFFRLKNKLVSKFKDVEFVEIEYVQKLIARIKKDKRLQKIIGGILIFIIAIGGVYYFTHRPEKKVYQVLIMVRDQQTSDPVEDARGSLKAGDVIVVYEQNREFSYTERISYLILNMKLTADQAQKLTEPKVEKLSRSELTKEQRDRISKNNEPWPTRTIRARAYRIKLQKFKNFDPIDLLNGQPYEKNIYDWWGMVERK
jgi:hypothetical protein